MVYILGLSRFSHFCFDDEKRIGHASRVVEVWGVVEVWENISHETE